MSYNVQNFINGEFRDALDHRTLDIINPSTAQSIGSLARSSAADVDAACEAAKAAFPTWSAAGAERRSAALLRVADEVERRFDEFAAAESADNGKPLSLARAVDIPRVIQNFRYFATYILHAHDEAFARPDALSYTRAEPAGVAALIVPWNLPAYLLSWRMAPALAFGCTVVAKPSEFTSVTAHLLAQCMVAAELPKGVCNLVYGLGAEVGAPLVVHKAVRCVAFTGGTVTGAAISRAAAPLFKRLSLELGGKNPNIILDDARLDECVQTSLRSSFANQGEICLCGSRIFVQRGVYDEFVQRFVAEAKRTLVVGDPLDERTTVGALVSEQHWQKVQACVERARQEGGKVLHGGRVPASSELAERVRQGYYYEPTIIVNLDMSCETLHTEIFGPVVTITAFDTDDEVVGYANGTEYGLSASVWTQSLERAHSIAHRIQAGVVWINTWLLRDLRTPFGGVKSSGIGRDGGRYSEEFFTEYKTVCIKL